MNDRPNNVKSLRFLLFNIAYATGPLRGAYHNVVSAHRYLRSERHHIDRICSYIEELAPDVTGLVEVERGSLRNQRVDQVAVIARHLAHHYTYGCKYGRRSVCRFLPILRQQGNVLLGREELTRQAQHFFPVGAKRLIMEVEISELRIFLVHLAITRRVRRRQIGMLQEVIGEKNGQPTIVAGDFNAFGGHSELAELLRHTGLRTLNREHAPTYPAYKPRKELDFILCSPEIEVDHFAVDAGTRLSDHLPLVADLRY